MESSERSKERSFSSTVSPPLVGGSSSGGGGGGSDKPSSSSGSVSTIASPRVEELKGQGVSPTKKQNSGRKAENAAKRATVSMTPSDMDEMRSMDPSPRKEKPFQDQLTVEKKKQKNQDKKKTPRNKLDKKSIEEVHVPSAIQQPIPSEQKDGGEGGDQPYKVTRQRRPQNIRAKNTQLDNRPLEEFLVMMAQWNKIAGDQDVETKKNPRTFVDLAGKCLNKYLTVNNLVKPHSLSSSRGGGEGEISYLEAATISRHVIAENSIKNAIKIREYRSALNSCVSVVCLLRQFIVYFVEAYHTLCGGHFSHVGTVIDAHLRTTYEALEDELGWSHAEENDIFRSLPVRGEFPPAEFRPENFEELETSFMTELASHSERLNTLPSLLRRLEGELVFRSSSIEIPDVDIVDLLNKSKTTPGNVHRALSTYISAEFSKLFSSRGGNLFTAARASTCFLLQAQTVIDLLSTHPAFHPLLAPSSQRVPLPSRSPLQYTPPPSSPPSGGGGGGGGGGPGGGRHVLDLPKNLPHASAQQGGSREAALSCKKPVAPGADDAGITVGDLFRVVESRGPGKTHPRADVAHACIAMFFDAPFTEFLSELEKQTRAVQLTQSPFFPSSSNFTPLFVHQDADFLMEYLPRNICSDYSQTFLLPSFKTLKMDEKGLEVLDSINRNNSQQQLQQQSSSILLTKLPQSSAISRIPVPQNYPTLFRKVPDGVLEIAESLHQLCPVSPNEKAEFLYSLLRQSGGPDTLSELQNSTDASEYEEKSINYVNRRNMTTGIFDMLRSTLRTINAYAYQFYHQHETTTHVEQLTARLASLHLGYTRAYSSQERPKDKTHLDIDLIIPFLFRNRHTILDVQKHKTTILPSEYEFHKSPLVQAIIRSLKAPRTTTSELIQKKVQGTSSVSSGGISSTGVGGGSGSTTKRGTSSTIPSEPQAPQEDQLLETHSMIVQLYAYWEESRFDPRAAHDLNNFILKITSPYRYDTEAIKDTIRVPLEALEASENFYNNCERQIQSYIAFLKQHEVALSDFNLDLPSDACPSSYYSVSSYSSSSVEVDNSYDAQAPIEIF